MRAFALLVLVLSTAAPARAQAPYVAAAIGAELSRFDHVSGTGNTDAGAEALAFALRVGTSLGDRWGVELSFTRPSEISRDTTYGYPIPLPAGSTVPAIPGLPTPAIFPPLDIRIENERRHTTIDTVAWLSQRAGSRADLVYLAGIAFARVTETVSYGFQTRPIGFILPPSSTRTTAYGVGPVVGLDARLHLTDHVMVVPGIRLHAISSGGTHAWLVRAAAGLGWRF